MAAAEEEHVRALPRFDSRVGSGGDVSIASYNILLQDFLNADDYPACAPEDIEWTTRRDRLMNEFLCLNTDFIALQECSMRYFEQEFMRPPLSDRYSAVVQKAKNHAPVHNFCAVTLYRHSDWDVEWVDHRSRTLISAFRRKLPPDERKAVDEVMERAREKAAQALEEELKKHEAAAASAAAAASRGGDGERNGHGKDADEKKAGKTKLTRSERKKQKKRTHNAAAKKARKRQPAWVKHDPKDLVYVVNVHLEGHPRAVDKRCSQLKSAVHRMALHQSDSKYAWLEHPDHTTVLIAGDFNSDHESSIYRALNAGGLKGGTRELGVVVTERDWEIPLKLRSAYGSSVGEPEFTFAVYGMVRPDPLDFIYFTPRTLRLLHVMEVEEPLVAARILHGRGLPDADHPSDHLPIAATFTTAHDAPFVDRVRARATVEEGHEE